MVNKKNYISVCTGDHIEFARRDETRYMHAMSVISNKIVSGIVGKSKFCVIPPESAKVYWTIGDYIFSIGMRSGNAPDHL